VSANKNLTKSKVTVRGLCDSHSDPEPHPVFCCCTVCVWIRSQALPSVPKRTRFWLGFGEFVKILSNTCQNLSKTFRGCMNLSSRRCPEWCGQTIWYHRQVSLVVPPLNVQIACGSSSCCSVQRSSGFRCSCTVTHHRNVVIAPFRKVSYHWQSARQPSSCATGVTKTDEKKHL
jgi:hypothetical protein